MKRKVLSVLLTGILCCQAVAVPSVAEARVTGEHIAITQLPGTIVEEKPYDDSFLKVTGYVGEGVNDRSLYYQEYLEYNRVLKEQWIADGNKEEDYVWQNTANYYVANNEQEFCDAIASYAKVVEITADLELGYKWLEEQEVDASGVISKASDYNRGNEPITSPDLIEKGVSKMSLKGRDGLTIFSRNGSTLYHCEIAISECNDIVIRNIGIQGLNEWDDIPFGMAGTPGYHKRYDWDNISIFASTNVWLDHCTLGIAYDGSIDTTDGSTASVTWCQIGVPDEKLMQEMQRTMDSQEELYQKGEAFQFYTALRDGGATKEQIMEFSLLNDKVQLIGANDTSYDVNIKDRSTIAYNYYKNAVQRVPQIISGNAHMFNCWIDSNDYRAIHTELSDDSIGTQTDANGNTISPMEYAANKGCSTLGLCRANSARNGGTIGTDTCIFEGVIDPIIGEEVQSDNINDTGILSGAVNHNLIVNSSTTDYGKETYIGSSWDNSGVNGFVGDSYWNGNRRAIGNFKWALWKNITKNESEAGDDVIYVPETEASAMAYGEFYNKFYIGSDSLGYEYQIVPLEQVKETLNLYSGCGKLDLSANDWIATAKESDSEKFKVGFFYDMAGISDTMIENVTAGAVIELPDTPVTEGYTFNSWYTKEYYIDENGEVTYKEVPFVENTPITKDTLVFAKWDINTYTLKLDLQGGTSTKQTEYSVRYNSIFLQRQIDTSAITKEGYTLEGWYLDEEYTKKFIYVNITEDITIYAKWQEAVPSSSPVPSQLPAESDAPTGSENPEVSETPSVSETPVLRGDVDNNGIIELSDAQLALKAALKIENLSGKALEAADYNMDNKIELSDAQMILKKALKIID